MARPRTSELERLETILMNLSRIVPDYPYELALLTRLSALLEKRAAEAANEALRPLDLSYVLYNALMIIHAGDGTSAPSDIADLTGERPNNVTHICNHLESLGLIARTPARDDRRRIAISLSGAGRRLLSRAQPLIWGLWRQRLKDSSAEQQAMLLQLLRRQIDNLGAADAQPPK